MPSVFDRLTSESRLLAGEVRQLAEAHLELAKLETQSAVDTLKRVAVALATAAVAAIVGLSVLAVALAEGLGEWTTLDRRWWMVILGVGLLLIAALVGLVARRRMRIELSMFNDTLSELREDVHWLKDCVTNLDRDVEDYSKDEG